VSNGQWIVCDVPHVIILMVETLMVEINLEGNLNYENTKKLKMTHDFKQFT